MSSFFDRQMTRREALRLTGMAFVGILAASCQPQLAQLGEGVEESQEAVEAPTTRREVRFGCPNWWLSLLPWTYEAIDRYNQEFPEMPEVKATRGEFDVTKLKLESASGITSYETFAGDTAFVQGLQVVATGAVVPWDPYYPADLREDTLPVFLEESTLNGELYLWPSHSEAVVIHWRRSYLDQVGLDKPASTWPEYQIQLDTLQGSVKSSGGEDVWPNAVDLNSWRAWLPLAIQIGGMEIFNEDGYPDISHPACADALRLLKTLTDYAPPETYLGTTAVNDAFASGLVAMNMSLVGTGAAAVAQSFGYDDWGFVPLPTPAQYTGSIRTTTWSSGFWLFAHSDLKDETAHFMQWLYADPDYWKALVTQANFTPCFKHIMYEEWTPQWMKDALSMSLEAATFIPNSMYFLTFHSHFMAAQTAFLQGEIDTAEEALQQAWDDFEEALAVM